MTKGKLLAYFANEETGIGGGDIENLSPFSGSLIFPLKKTRVREKQYNSFSPFWHTDIWGRKKYWIYKWYWKAILDSSV